MPSSRFSYSSDQLRDIAASVLDYAKTRGATSSETEVSEGFGQTVTVRRGEVETIEYNRDKGIGVTVYVGQKRGHASSSDFSPQALRDTVDAALSIARFTAPDDCAGLADPELLARDIPDLDLWHPWDLPVERAIELAKIGEDAGFAVDRASAIPKARPSRRRNRSSSTAIRSDSSPAIPTRATASGARSSRAKGDAMQRDDWYETARDPLDLAAARGRGTPGRASAR